MGGNHKTVASLRRVAATGRQSDPYRGDRWWSEERSFLDYGGNRRAIAFFQSATGKLGFLGKYDRRVTREDKYVEDPVDST
jgi:hypothetical protein